MTAMHSLINFCTKIIQVHGKTALKHYGSFDASVKICYYQSYDGHCISWR